MQLASLGLGVYFVDPEVFGGDGKGFMSQPAAILIDGRLTAQGGAGSLMILFGRPSRKLACC